MTMIRVARSHILLLALMGGFVVLLSCGEDTSKPPGPVTFESVVAGGGVYETVTPSEEAVDLEPEVHVDDDGTTWECEVTHYTMVECPDNYHTFNPNADVIYPGCLLQGGTIHHANPTPIAVPRGGGTIVINSTNGDPVTHVNVEEVSLSRITTAVNELIAEHGGELPMRLSLEIHDVSSFEELAFRLGVNVSSCTVDFRSQMRFSTDKTYNRFMVKLNQQFYTMMFQTPTSLDEFFADDVRPEHLAPYIEAGNPATYISSVTYGRAFYLLVESTACKDSMDIAVQTSWGGIVSGDVEGDVNKVKRLSDVKFHLFAMGGSSQDILPLFQMDPQALNDFISTYEVESGVPLSYSIRNLKDNSMVGVKVATEFDVLNCTTVALGDRYSGFETGSTDGWTTEGSVSEFRVTDDPPSNLGGYYLHARDEMNTSNDFFFRVPNKFTGNWGELYGGTLTYYLWTSHNVPDDGRFGATDLRIFATYYRSLGLCYHDADNGVSIGYPNAGGFKRYDIPLDTRYNWQYSAPGINRTATEEDIRGVFGDVVGLTIRGEFIVGDDWARLDEVQLQRP